MKDVKLAQIGFGSWGKNLARAFKQTRDSDLVAICDQNKNFLECAQSNYPQVKTYQDCKELINESIDAVIISTPPPTHYQIAKFFLEHGKHVFVEKPATLAYEDAVVLSRLSQENKCVFMVGHTFLYHSGIQYIKNNLEAVGDLCYLKSSRLNFGRIRSDVNAWWNLAPHDISIFLYLMNQELPESISVDGISCIQKNCPDYVRATLSWKSGLRGFIDMTWLAPCKERGLIITGKDSMFVFNDLFKEKVELHKKYMRDFTENHEGPQQYSQGVEIPLLTESEPLFVEASHFIECIKNPKLPCLTGAEHILKVMKILELGQESMNQHGETLKIEFNELLTSNL